MRMTSHSRSGRSRVHTRTSDVRVQLSLPNAWHSRLVLPADRSDASQRQCAHSVQCAAVEQDIDVTVRSHRNQQGSAQISEPWVPPAPPADGITSRRRINRLIKRASSLLELRVVLEKESASFDSVNTSHVMNTLANMYRSFVQHQQRTGVQVTPEVLAAQRAEHVMPCLAVLEGLIRSNVDRFEAWDVSLVLWSMSVLEYYNRQLFDVLCNKAVQLVDVMKPVDAANIMTAFGRWGHYHPELIQHLPQVIVSQMYESKPHEISTCLWGFARLRIPATPGRPFLLAICEDVHHNMHAYPSKELSNILWSLAKLQFYPGVSFLQRAESIMLQRLRSQSELLRSTAAHQQRQQYQQQTEHQRHQVPLNPQHTGVTYAQHAQRGVPVELHPQQEDYSFESVSSRNGSSAHSDDSVLQHVNGFEDSHDWDDGQGGGMLATPPPAVQVMVPQDMANTLYAFGQMRYKAVWLLDELPLCLGLWLPDFTITDVCCLLNGYANARHYHRGVLEVLAPILARNCASLSLRDIVSVFTSYAVFQHVPQSEQHFFPMLTRSLATHVREFRPQTYALLLKSCANLQYRPEAMLPSITAAAASRLTDFKPHEMANLLYGLSYLVSRAPHCNIRPAEEQQYQQQQQHEQQQQQQAASNRRSQTSVPVAATPPSILQSPSSPSHTAEATTQSTSASSSATILKPANAMLAQPSRPSMPSAAVQAQAVNHDHHVQQQQYDDEQQVQQQGVSDGSASSGLHPSLRPEDMQVFYGVVKQCIRILDEPNHPYAEASHMHHQVLNSIVLSCMRVGYMPWALVDFAESKGYRLTNNVYNKPSQQQQSTGSSRPRKLSGRARAAAASTGQLQSTSQDSTHSTSQAPLEQAQSSSSAQVQQLAADGSVYPSTGPPPRANVTSPGRARRGQFTAPPGDFDSTQTRRRRMAGLDARPRQRLFRQEDEHEDEHDDEHYYEDDDRHDDDNRQHHAATFTHSTLPGRGHDDIRVQFRDDQEQSLLGTSNSNRVRPSKISAAAAVTAL